MDHNILNTTATWIGEGRKVALATVIETWGSAPQPVGSQLVVDADGNFMGAVSGGCVEGDVITEAIDAISSGHHKTLQFGVADETAWRVGLACGGKIRIYVEPVA
jgi:xanthine/CO dehydrogenase XdhC/CoxF family maturation factor